MLVCAQSKTMAVKVSSQKLSIGKAGVALTWPLFVLVSMSSGLQKLETAKTTLKP